MSTITITITTTTRPVPLFALALLAGCDASSGPPPAPAATAPAATAPAAPTEPTHLPAAMTVPDNNQGHEPMSPLRLRWTMSKASGALSIDYTVENTGQAAVWLLDRTVIPKIDGVHPAFDRVSVLAGERPEIARLVLGHVRPAPGHTVASEYTPGARRLEPGASAEGHLRVPLPLASWSPYLTLDPLPATPTRAVLELGWLSDDPPESVAAWDAWTPVIGEGDLKIPTLAYTVQRQRLARGEEQPIP